MTYEEIVFAWNAQADEHNQYDTLSDRERIEFALECAKKHPWMTFSETGLTIYGPALDACIQGPPRPEQPIAKIVCGTGGGCSLEFTNGADSLDYAGCDVYLRPPIAQEPHPPTRHCMCEDCAPSFDPTPDGMAPAVTDAMALAFHSALTDSSIGQGEIDEIKTGLRAALCAAKPVENRGPVAIYKGPIDCGEYGAFDLEMLKMIPRGSKLYTATQPCPSCEVNEAIGAGNTELMEMMQAECASKQAKIDALMLEYCPNEMTAEQLVEWGEHQVSARCPECEKLKDDVAELEGCRELNRCAIKNLKAERDRLQAEVARVYMEVTGGLCSKESTPASVVISLFEDYLSKRVDEEVSDVVKERDELAAQVEKMREALKLSERCFDLIKDVKGPLDWHLIFKSELVIKRALSTPDLSTGILNRVRAEASRKAADICDVHATGWKASPGCNPMAGFIASSNCATDIRALAADMEEGKC